MKKLLNLLFSSWYFKIGLLGLVIRLILMPISAHPDVWALDFARYFLVEKKVLNIYDFLANLPSDDPLIKNYGTNFFTYPPLAYFTLGFFGFLFKFFYKPELTPWIMANYPKIYNQFSIYGHLFLAKLPYLFFDLGIAFLLLKLFAFKKEKKLAFLLWVFNPLSLYSAYLVGQFELIPLFFVTLALYLAQLNKKEMSVFSLGVGGAYKMFPLFFLPVLAFSLGKNVWKRISLLILGLVPFAFSIVPFLKSASFRQLVLFSPQSKKFFHLTLPVSGAEGITLFIFVWGLIFFASIYNKKSQSLLWVWFLAILLAFFSLTHYHPQWFVWLAPLLIIQLVKTEFKFSFLTLAMLLSWLIITLFFESSLNYALFVPLSLHLWQAPSLSEIVSRYYDVFQLKTIIRSLFAAVSFSMIIFTLRSMNDRH